ALHQVTKWTFKQGKLVAFKEIISFPESNETVACEFTPNMPPPFPYSMDSPANNAIIMIGFGCPQPSTNERPEAFVIIPERDGREFSYLEYSPSSTQVSDQNTPAHFSGHATTR
ncbi:MAG: hypothetical protein ACREPW_01520, partial [Candidatus Binataceae bacterium]